MRTIHAKYRDPLELIWAETARLVGLSLVRSREVNASTDGAGNLVLGAEGTLDADDSTAQMVFHELCHSLVEGPDSFARPDWGLDNQSERDVVREHACLRVQAVLARRHGLREVLAPTTDFRAFYDALPADPLAPRGEPSVALAIAALRRVDRPPWAPHLGAALAATAAIARAAAGFDLDRATLLSRATEPPAPHPGGLPAGDGGRCGDCAWRAGGACLQSGAAVDADWPGCERFEPPVECGACGACCREGYDSVTVDDDDPVIARRPALVVVRPTYVELRRAGPRCAALDGAGDPATPYRCAIYDDRPRCCRELEAGGEHCLTARRRVGLSL